MTVTAFPYTITPLPNLQPFTYQDGMTYTRILEDMRVWLNNSLVPELTAITGDTLVQFQEGITNAEDTITELGGEWETRFDAFIANITAEIATLNTAAVAGMLTGPGAARAALDAVIDAEIAAIDASLRTYIDDQDGALADDIALKLDADQKGATNGVAPLVAGKVPAANLPTPATVTLTGLYSVRPAAASHPAGTLYYATDTLELYRTNGTAWAVFGAAGNELAFVGIDPSVPMFTTTSTTYVDVPGLSINVTAGERPFVVKFQCAGAASSPAPVKYALYVDGVLRREFDFRASGIDEWETFGGEHTMRGLTPGVSYVAKIMVKAWTGTTARTSGAPHIQAVGL